MNRPYVIGEDQMREIVRQRDDLLAACKALLEISPKRESDRWDRAVNGAREAITSAQIKRAKDPAELLRSHSDLFRVARRFEAWVRAEICGETHDDQERLSALPGIVAALARSARFASDDDCQPTETHDAYEPGALVMVYHDPIEKQRREGIARLLDRARSNKHGESWIVQFPDKDAPCERFLAYPAEKGAA